MRQQYEGYYNIHALLHGLPSLKNQKEYQQKETFWRIRITIGKNICKHGKYKISGNLNDKDNHRNVNDSSSHECA